jgi:hypothetical protein
MHERATLQRGLKIPRGFQSSPEGDSRRLLHLFPPLKRRAIARRPARAGLEHGFAHVFRPGQVHVLVSHKWELKTRISAHIPSHSREP